LPIRITSSVIFVTKISLYQRASDFTGSVVADCITITVSHVISLIRIITTRKNQECGQHCEEGALRHQVTTQLPPLWHRFGETLT
jgi:hypothetical protein